MMKKSGTLLASVAVPSARLVDSPLVIGDSADILVAPLAHHVTTEIVAQRLDLSLEASAQLAHELLVRRRGILIDHASPFRAERLAAQLSGRQRIHGPPQRARFGRVAARGPG